MELNEATIPSVSDQRQTTIPKEHRASYVGTHVVYLMDLRDGSVQKRHFGPDLRLGAVED